MSRQGVMPLSNLPHQGHVQLCRIGGGTECQADLSPSGGACHGWTAHRALVLACGLEERSRGGGESNARPGIGIRSLQQATGVGPQGRKGTA